MKLQVAFDRLDLEETLQILDQTHQEIDIIEIGTSLILKYGVAVIGTIRERYPNSVILADTKIFDNVTYELNLCFDSGADIVSILGCATESSLDLAFEIAKSRKQSILIDMLGTSENKKKALMERADELTIYCFHHGKDDQLSGKRHAAERELNVETSPAKFALAGGVDPQLIHQISGKGIDTVIVGGYITKSQDPLARVLEIKEAMHESN